LFFAKRSANTKQRKKDVAKLPTDLTSSNILKIEVKSKFDRYTPYTTNRKKAENDYKNQLQRSRVDLRRASRNYRRTYLSGNVNNSAGIPVQRQPKEGQHLQRVRPTMGRNPTF
jgi:hypothetical protein